MKYSSLNVVIKPQHHYIAKHNISQSISYIQLSCNIDSVLLVCKKYLGTLVIN